METLREGVSELYGVCKACDGEYTWDAKGGWVETCPNCGAPIQGMSKRLYDLTKQAAKMQGFFSGIA